MTRYARVVVDVAPAHLDRPFDYAVPAGTSVGVGQRVQVVFAGRRRIGWVTGLAAEPSMAAERIRPLLAVHGEVTWFGEPELRLFRWVADRYAGTLADVLRHALPRRVAAVEAEVAASAQRASAGDREPTSPQAPPAAVPTDRSEAAAGCSRRAPGDGGAVAASPVGSGEDELWRHYAAGALLGAVGRRFDGPPPAFLLRPLPGEDTAGLVADLVRRCLAAGQAALVVAADPASALPDAALRAAGGGADYRPAAPRSRYAAFLRGRAGLARVAAGERAAVFAPLRDLGLVVVDDEANPAHKERRRPRHHVREVALARARLAGAVCVLLGDLPSAAAWRLLRYGHLQGVAGDRGVERARAPTVEVVDLAGPRRGAQRTRLAPRTARVLGQAVARGGAAVVLAARGGQGSALACRMCRRRRGCPVCDSGVAAARDGEGWRCPTCGWSGPPSTCPDCGEHAVAPLAAGAGRLAQELARSHPDAEVVRMEGFDAPGPARRPGIGVMTRGSVVTRPAWLRGGSADVVVLPDADALLSRPVMDAAEDALRLWLAVGRWTRHVVLQTREPAHPAVQALVRWDPEGFWERETQRRGELRWPPHASLVRLSAAPADAPGMAAEVREVLPGDEILGPDLEGALLVKTADLRATLARLTPLRHAWDKAGRGVRLDVDPL